VRVGFVVGLLPGNMGSVVTMEFFRLLRIDTSHHTLLHPLIAVSRYIVVGINGGY
jgi:hypothetical protein